MSLLSIIQNHAREKPYKVVYVSLEAVIPESLTYKQLYEKSLQLATSLTLQGANKGDRILIALPQSLEYLIAFWGCLFGGFIAVPVFPAIGTNHSNRTSLILKDTEAKYVLSTLKHISTLPTEFDRSIFLDIQTLLMEDDTFFEWQEPASDSIAFLQYTSGSTSNPKGVIVKYNNIQANLEMLMRGICMNTESRIVSWLPFFHDMGLIGNVLLSAYVGAQLYFMSPNKFIKNPLGWLKSISDNRGTHTFAPNFAYEMCVNEAKSKMVPHMDLSSLEFTVNGAEPVRAKTMLDFSEKFIPYGFKHQSWTPGYGMAEATLFVTHGRDWANGIKIEKIDSIRLQTGKCVLNNQSNNDTREFPSHGKFNYNQELKIVDPGTKEPKSFRETGEIWVKGPHICSGYWNKNVESQETFFAYATDNSGPWLRTGDLGYLNESGELFIVGRCKDVIIFHGKNYSPSDIEQSIEKCDDLIRTNHVIAFSIDDINEEKLVVTVELRKAVSENDIHNLSKKIKKVLLQDHNLVADNIVFVGKGGIPKTTSGKLQRQLCKQRYLLNELPPIVIEKNADQIETA